MSYTVSYHTDIFPFHNDASFQDGGRHGINPQNVNLQESTLCERYHYL